MHTSELTSHGYIMAEPPVIQGTPAGEFFNGLLRGLVHKQNNFLAVIQGFSSLILMDGDLDPVTKENLDHMKEAAQGAAVLAERILAAGGCVRITPQAVQLKDYLHLMDAALRAPFEKLGVPFQINIAPQLPAVLVDSGRFREILTDLLLNAAEAVAASGQPGVAALDVLPPGQIPESRPGCVDILVRNTGPVIPVAKLRDVFKPFNSTRDNKHFGIGLVVAAVTASQMRATLGTKSTPEATTFWLSVPTV